jgi:hypothetical protein
VVFGLVILLGPVIFPGGLVTTGLLERLGRRFTSRHSLTRRAP